MQIKKNCHGRGRDHGSCVCYYKEGAMLETFLCSHICFNKRAKFFIRFYAKKQYIYLYFSKTENIFSIQ